MTVSTGARSGKAWLLALLVGPGTAACERAVDMAIPPPSEDPTVATAVPDRSSTPAPPVVSNAAGRPPTDSPKPVDRFAQPPRTERRTLAHILEPKARVGVYLGLPDGWRNDDPSYLLFFPWGRGPKPPARAVAMTLSATGPTIAKRAQLLRRGCAPTGLRDATWGPWRDAIIGRDRFVGSITLGAGHSLRGSEGPRSAMAVVVRVPGAPALGFIGSWATAEPQHEATIVDMLRALERCRIEVGRGCVTATEHRRASL